MRLMCTFPRALFSQALYVHTPKFENQFSLPDRSVSLLYASFSIYLFWWFLFIFSGVPKFLVFFKSFLKFLFLSFSSLNSFPLSNQFSIQFRTDFLDFFRAHIKLQLYPFSKKKKNRGGSGPNPFDFFFLLFLVSFF